MCIRCQGILKSAKIPIYRARLAAIVEQYKCKGLWLKKVLSVALAIIDSVWFMPVSFFQQIMG